MKMKNLNATRSFTGIIDLRLREKVQEIVNDLVGRAHVAFEGGDYFALQEAIIDAPADLGVVRAVATAHHQHQYTEGYKYAVNKREDTAGIEIFDPSTDAVVMLTVFVPVFGNIQAEVRMNPKSERVNAENITIRFDGAVGSLWYKSALDILDKVKNANLLAAPQVTETLDA